MKQEVWFHYLASGCVSKCMHCARLGHGTRPMSLDSIESIFRELRKLKDSSYQFEVIDTPMFEVMAHPNPLGIFRKRAEILGDYELGGISSSGTSIGMREDWREQLEGLKELGVNKYWLTLHGAGKIHDHYVGRTGSYSLVTEAVRRIHDVGLTCGTNVFLNTDNLESFSDQMAEIESAGFDEYYFGITVYFPYERYRRYDVSRPAIDLVRPHVNKIKALDKYPGDKWDNLPSYTESAWIEKAQGSTESDDEPQWRMGCEYSHVLELVGTSDLNVCDGDLSYPATVYGNIPSDGFGKAFTLAKTAKEAGEYRSMTDLRNFYGDIDPPSVSELASLVGLRDSTKIDFNRGSIRMQWLDRMYQEQRLM